MLLSLCMIVKNEQEVLERCLESVKNVVDEIIILDTGSTDRTKEIALSYTSHFLEFEWIKDFSAARNESIRNASGKWILVLDADEYFAPEEGARLRSFLETVEPSPLHVFSINVINFVGKSLEQGMITSGEVPRLFPNFQGIHFQRPIHEQLHSNQGELTSSLAPISIFHTGYLKDRVEQKSKLERNAELFTQLKKNTGFSAYDYYTLGNECSVAGDSKKAIYYYERAIKKQNQPLSSSWYSHCLISLTLGYLNQHRFYDAWEIIESKLLYWKDYPEYRFLKANMLHYLGFTNEAREGYEEAIATASIKATDSVKFWIESADFASTIPMRKLVSIFESQENWEKAVYYLTNLLKQDLHDYSALRSLLKILLRFDDVASITSLLDRIYDSTNNRHQYILFRSSLAVYDQNLTQFYFERLSINNEKALSQEDKLFYFFLVKDKNRYHETAASFAGEVDNQLALVTHAAASYLWELKVELKFVDSSREAYKQIISFLKNDGLESQLYEHSPILVFELLKVYYQVQEFELFDEILKRCSSPEILNLIANHFFEQKNTELALNFYTLLLEQNLLSPVSLENLGIYHLNNGFTEEGLEFIDTALKTSPQTIHLYVLYLKHCQNPLLRKSMQKRLLQEFSAARKIPFFAAIMN
ncbi:glycosyltransferase [Paenibacillus pasadenensis]|uniref:TPR domain-containing glycosyltransferase n=1 Tax=Paenibacillus pasadenensis TaxID=217090 RepID=UPI00203CAED8|nr:TPR domain-containing glycosyltransferase [Paenibacillus pasadenensis]MCM3750202.1 glycosyltransferase [Paenibacillus pasadenensis]